MRKGTPVISNKKGQPLRATLLAQSGLTALLRLLQLDFYVDAGRQVELHQGVNRLVGRVDDVHQTLVRADLELVARGLVDVRRTQDVETLHAGRQGHRALDDRASALGGFHDFQSRLVDQLVVERLQADADLLLLHDDSFKERAVHAPRFGETGQPGSHRSVTQKI